MNRSLILALGALMALSGPLAPARLIAQEAPATTPAPDGGLDGGPVEEAPADGGGAEDGSPLPDGSPLGDALAAEAAPHVPGPLTDRLAGPYLAARQAASDSNFAAAAEYFTRALAQDPGEPFLIDSALVSLISAGQEQPAAEIAKRLQGTPQMTELAGLVDRAALAKAEDWAGLAALLKSAPTGTSPEAQGGRLLDGMLGAWAELGQGRATEAMARFKALRSIPGAAQMVDYNLALVKASVGDFEGAEAELKKPGVGAHLVGTIVHAEVLAQLDRRDEALSVIADQPGASDEPQLLALSAALTAGQPVPFTGLKNARDGVAQTLLTFATALASGEGDPDPLALIHARLAGWIAPDLGEAHLVTAQLLQAVGQYDLAEAEYDALRKLGAVRPVAELARIDALARAGRLEDAEKAALALTAGHPELASAWVAQGDILRQAESYKAAVPAYDKALALIGQDKGDARWFPLYARGIAKERSGDFKGAEADMRAALAIRPDQAPVLNYLGYSFVDRGKNLDEAMAMIEKAAKLSPEDGYIQDSLAWGYYRLGRYAEAVAPMERAATEMADDPLINDHLGDIYWKAGRQREAEVQWRRALSLGRAAGDKLKDLDLDRVRAKIQRGLDAVLADEAAGRPLLTPTPTPTPEPVANGD